MIVFAVGVSVWRKVYNVDAYGNIVNKQHQPQQTLPPSPPPPLPRVRSNPPPPTTRKNTAAAPSSSSPQLPPSLPPKKKATVPGVNSVGGDSGRNVKYSAIVATSAEDRV